MPAVFRARRFAERVGQPAQVRGEAAQCDRFDRELRERQVGAESQAKLRQITRPNTADEDQRGKR